MTAAPIPPSGGAWILDEDGTLRLDEPPAGDAPAPAPDGEPARPVRRGRAGQPAKES